MSTSGGGFVPSGEPFSRCLSRRPRATSLSRSNAARRRAISSGVSRSAFEKSSFHDGSSLQRSGERTVVRGAVAVSSRRSASSSVCALRLDVAGSAARVAEREVAPEEARHAGRLDDVLGAAHDRRSGCRSLRGAARPDSRSGGRPVRWGRAAPRRRRSRARRRARPARRRRSSSPGCDWSARRRDAARARRGVPPRPLRAGARSAARCRGLRGVGVDAVVAEVRDAQVRRGIDRQRVHLVELRRRVVGSARPLIAGLGSHRRRRRHQRETRLGERTAKRRERNVVVVRPAVRIAVAEREVVRARALDVGDRQVVATFARSSAWQRRSSPLRSLPPIPSHRLLDRQSRQRTEVPHRPTHRDEAERRHRLGQAERLGDRGAIHQPERRRRGAETESARGEQQVLHARPHRAAGARRVRRR